MNVYVGMHAYMCVCVRVLGIISLSQGDQLCLDSAKGSDSEAIARAVAALETVFLHEDTIDMEQMSSIGSFLSLKIAVGYLFPCD